MLIRRANCKVNLALDVVARREDGWHDIDSVLVQIDWHDLVGVAIAPAPRASVSLRLTGTERLAVPDGGDNLAYRAAATLVRLCPTPIGVAVWIDKSVPVSAGLGGGSADAAAVLDCGTSRLAGAGIFLDRDALRTEALSLGSDVPALLTLGAQRVRGKGEVLHQVTIPVTHLAVAVAGQSSTASTYAALDARETGASSRVDRLIEGLRSGYVDESTLGSALEPAAFRASPHLRRDVERLRRLTPRRLWHMTGSGGALFCVARDSDDAHSLAALARENGFVARACRTLRC